MKSLTRICFIALLAVAASGCVFIDGEHVKVDDWRDDQRDNRKMISQLEMGSTRSEVVEEMGTPSDSEAFTVDGEEVRVLFYRTQHKHSDGETSRDETTPLIFKNDLLVGWGENTYRELRS